MVFHYRNAQASETSHGGKPATPLWNGRGSQLERLKQNAGTANRPEEVIPSSPSWHLPIVTSHASSSYLGYADACRQTIIARSRREKSQ